MKSKTGAIEAGIAAIETVLRYGQFYHSCIELDVNDHGCPDGETLEAQLKVALDQLRAIAINV